MGKAFECQFTAHAVQMLVERRIEREWVDHVLAEPDGVHEKEDGTVHYVGAIARCGGRVLRVVINPSSEPPRVVTAFFDRRLGRRS